MGSLAMSPYFQQQPTPAYKVSKTALNMLTVQYAEAFREEGVTFVAVCPGWVKTDLGGKDYADLTPDESVNGILEKADRIDAKDTGKFFTIRVPGWENNQKQYDGSVRPW
ncbi:hypothetical protein SLS64_012347 [Diaporthe eres]|uniref:Short chain oxidoreductase n=1 Tax=Diaporthe eres TaxID=83184 RepID=A0ABR1P0M9_DIAER